MSQEFIADMGEYVISVKPDVLLCLALGSCVGVGMFDPIRQIGGLAHVMLPSSNGMDLSKVKTINKYADIAIPNMLKDLKAKGCDPSRMIIKIAGGAHMFKGLGNSLEDIGRKNAESVKAILAQNNLKIRAEELGGSIGRTVRLYLDDGKYEIKTKDELKVI